MITIGDALLKLGADITGLDQGLKSADASVNRFSEKVAKRMKIVGTALLGAALAIGGASLKMASDFDGAMREVNTMMLLSEEQFKAFSKEIQTVSRELGVSATSSAKALYQAISAGVPKENVVDFLKVATKAAIGGVTETVTAVDGLTTVLNAFRIPVSEAQKVADIMFTTVKGGKTTFEELSASMFNVAPIAASMNIAFETVAAALATMTKQGVPTATATTQLRQAMVALSKPTADMQIVLEQLGYSSGQAMVEELGLAGALNALRDATKGSNDQLMKMFGSVEAGAAVLALTGQNAEIFQADLDAVANSAGAATDAFEQMEESVGRKFDKMKAQFQDIGITIGTALIPVVTKLLKSLTPLIEKLGLWVENHSQLTLALLAGTAVLGILLIALPKLIFLFGILKSVKIALTAVQWKLNAAMSANPIGLIILAVGALVIGIIALVRNWSKVVHFFRGPAARAMDELKRKTKELGDAIISEMTEATKVAISKAQEMVNAQKGVIDDFIRFLEGRQYEGQELLTDEQLARIRELKPELADQIQAIQDGIKGIRGEYETLDRELSEIRIAEIAVQLGDPRLTKEETLSLLDELADLQSKEWKALLRDNEIDLIAALNQQKTDLDIALAEQFASWEDHFADIERGWDGTLAYLRDVIIPALNRAIAEGILSEEAAAAIEAQFAPILEAAEQLRKVPPGGYGVAQPGTPEQALPPPLKIPSLQHGGIVPGPVGQPRLVMAHGGEQYAGVGQTLGGDIHLHIGNFMGDETSMRHLGQRLKQILQENNRRNAFPQVSKGYYYGKSGL